VDKNWDQRGREDESPALEYKGVRFGGTSRGNEGSREWGQGEEECSDRRVKDQKGKEELRLTAIGQ